MLPAVLDLVVLRPGRKGESRDHLRFGPPAATESAEGVQLQLRSRRLARDGQVLRGELALAPKPK
jgi:hypothetical protein